MLSKEHTCGTKGKSLKNIRMMPNYSIDYAKMVDNAMRSVLRQALDCATEEGLPGSHNFYITFATRKVGVDIPASLIAQYPEEMTIVLEHKFWDLSTTDDGFSVTLSFNRKYEKLFIPFHAVKAFVDPSVKFGLQFDTDGGDTQAQSEVITESPTIEEISSVEKSKLPRVSPKNDTVITLDSFRKK